MLRGLADGVASVLLAPLCACCRTALPHPTRGAVCRECWNAIPSQEGPLCRVCGDAVDTTDADPSPCCARCRRSRRVISTGRSIGPYEGTLREIIQAFKYDGRRSLARPLAERMARAGADVLRDADVVVPVPLYFTRQYMRGFNQAAELARHLGVGMVNALKRARATVTQTDLPEPQRHDNVMGAFTLRREVPRGSVLVVVDDVSTTGATLDACARVLLDGGAAEVRGLTAARAASRLA